MADGIGFGNLIRSRAHHRPALSRIACSCSNDARAHEGNGFGWLRRRLRRQRRIVIKSKWGAPDGFLVRTPRHPKSKINTARDKVSNCRGERRASAVYMRSKKYQEIENILEKNDIYCSTRLRTIFAILSHLLEFLSVKFTNINGFIAKIASD